MADPVETVLQGVAGDVGEEKTVEFRFPREEIVWDEDLLGVSIPGVTKPKRSSSKAVERGLGAVAKEVRRGRRGKKGKEETVEAVIAQVASGGKAKSTTGAAKAAKPAKSAKAAKSAKPAKPAKSAKAAARPTKKGSVEATIADVSAGARKGGKVAEAAEAPKKKPRPKKQAAVVQDKVRKIRDQLGDVVGDIGRIEQRLPSSFMRLCRGR